MELVSLRWIKNKYYEKIYKKADLTEEEKELVKKYIEIKKSNLERFKNLGKEKVVKNIRDDLAMVKKMCGVLGVAYEFS